MPQSYTIARLAEAAGVHVETIRYYQRRELLPKPMPRLGGVRKYTDADVERLRFIKRAQAMGFTLAEIDSLLILRSNRSCRATRDLASAKLRVVDARLRELRHLRKELAGLISSCDANTEDSICPVIERLAIAADPAAQRIR